MTSIQSGYSLTGANVRAIDTGLLKPISVAEESEEFYQQFIRAQESFLQARHTSFPGVADHPGYKRYASVVVDGKTVAKIDNFGGVESSNAMAGKIRRAIDDADRKSAGKSGPAAAQARAEAIADTLGGKIVPAATAMSQTAFNATPAPKPTVDQAALQADPLYEQLQKLKQARSLFLTQQAAQEDA